jgi:hypothetical protein
MLSLTAVNATIKKGRTTKYVHAFLLSKGHTWRFLIIVGVCVAYNFQTGKKIKLLTEYESVTQRIFYL